MHHLVRALLHRTENRQYSERLFGTVFNKLYDFAGLPSSIKDKLLQNLLGREPEFKHPQVIPPLLKSNKETVEAMRAYELMAFCEVLLNDIVGCLPFFPVSLRYLLKTIEQHILENVSLHSDNSFPKTTLRKTSPPNSSSTSYSTSGGFRFWGRRGSAEC